MPLDELSRRSADWHYQVEMPAGKRPLQILKQGAFLFQAGKTSRFQRGFEKINRPGHLAGQLGAKQSCNGVIRLKAAAERVNEQHPFGLSPTGPKADQRQEQPVTGVLEYFHTVMSDRWNRPRAMLSQVGAFQSI